ncbi:MAG: molybdate ABC transporter substrate-binding protein [Helicobacter sp.]|nr:molybdate ABC transporter substrate-binding protein [Helicobacter sp.]MDE5817444.1 molybdate ABC transporter substrate-binding protein [Helicobacter sp.]MDE6044102.1 molybdate ABC transporter substrate-binding protein [Helicobacter sp.]
MKKLLLLVCMLAMSAQLYAENIRVFVAASAKDAMSEVTDTFLKTRKNDNIELSFGASGKAYQQFSQGLEYDLFFSADSKYPAQIVKDGQAAGEPHVYVLGVVALYALDSKLLDGGVAALKDKEKQIKHLSIANPKVAPYGIAAEEILKNLKLYDVFESRIVRGDNIAQAVSFVDSGAAEVGLVAYSLLSDPSKRKNAVVVDSALHNKMEQSFVITKRAAKSALAKAFSDYITSGKADEIFKKYGFGTPARQ